MRRKGDVKLGVFLGILVMAGLIGGIILTGRKKRGLQSIRETYYENQMLSKDDNDDTCDD